MAIYAVLIFFILWLLLSSKNEMTPELAKKIILNYSAFVQKYQSYFSSVPIETIYAVIGVESAGNPDSIGDNGKAYGLMQIHQAALTDVNNYLGKSYTVEDLKTPYVNVEVGTCYLFLKMRELGFKIEPAIRAYNGGLGGKESADAYAYLDRVKRAQKIILEVMKTL